MFSLINIELFKREFEQNATKLRDLIDCEVLQVGEDNLSKGAIVSKWLSLVRDKYKQYQRELDEKYMIVV